MGRAASSDASESRDEGMEFERRRRRSFLGLGADGFEVEGRAAPVFSARRSRSSSERASGEESRECSVREGGEEGEGRWRGRGQVELTSGR